MRPAVAVLLAVLACLARGPVALADLGPPVVVSSASDGTPADTGGGLDPAWGPEGTRIAFASAATNLVPDAVEGTHSQIYVKDLASGATTLIGVGRDAFDAHAPHWSPDGGRLLYVSGSPYYPGNTLRLADLATGTVAAVEGPNGPLTQVFESAWRPDGRYVAFASADPQLIPGNGDMFESIFIEDLATRAVVAVSVALSTVSTQRSRRANGASRSPVWSSDGRYLAFSSSATDLLAGPMPYGGIYVYDTVTGQLRLGSPADGSRRMTMAGMRPESDINQAPYEHRPWSPDSTKLLFVSAVAGPSGDWQPNQLYVYDVATGGVTLVSAAPDGSPGDGASGDTGAYWSPDGRKVMFGSLAGDIGGDAGGVGIFVSDVSSASTTLVAARAGDPHWSPDGAWIARSGGGQVAMRLATGESLVFNPPGNVIGPAAVWSPDSTRIAFGSMNTPLIPGLGTPQLYVRRVSEAPVATPAPAPSPAPAPLPAPIPGLSVSCGDAAIVGVRGSGDNARGQDSPGRHAAHVANLLRGHWGLKLYDAPSADSDPRDGVIGLDYPASSALTEIHAYKVSHDAGVRSLLAQIAAIENPVSGCGPGFPVVLVGFSQGAQVIQSVLDKLNDRAPRDDTWRSIAGVALLASPRFSPLDETARATFLADYPLHGIAGAATVPARFRAMTRSYCLANDPVCVSDSGSIGGTVIKLNKTHTQAYDPGSKSGNPILEDAAGLLAWGVDRLRGSAARGGNPAGVLAAYRQNATNTVRLSAAAVYPRGVPADTFSWDFDGDGRRDGPKTHRPWIAHSYGVAGGRVTTKVTIQRVDGSSTLRSICIRRAAAGRVTC